MAEEIYVKPGDLSSGILRKAISRAESAQKKARSAEDDAHWGHRWSWGGNTYWLYSTNSEWLISDAESKLSKAKSKLEKLAAILDSGPDALQEIDRRYKSDLKEWRKKVNHQDILWVTGGGATAQEIVIDLKQTSKINLTPNMGNYSYRQGDYSEFTYPYGYNAGCAAVAHAIGLSIVTGEPYDPRQFWHDGERGYQTYYDRVHIGGWESYNPEIIYQNLVAGKPTQLAYIYASSPASQEDADHFVIITGIKEGADPHNLSFDDFLVIDPAYGDERLLSESWKFNPERVTGGFVIFN